MYFLLKFVDGSLKENFNEVTPQMNLDDNDDDDDESSLTLYAPIEINVKFPLVISTPSHSEKL